MPSQELEIITQIFVRGEFKLRDFIVIYFFPVYLFFSLPIFEIANIFFYQSVHEVTIKTSPYVKL